MKSFIVCRISRVLFAFSFVVVVACEVYDPNLIEVGLDRAEAIDREIPSDIEIGDYADGAIVAHDIDVAEDAADDSCSIECPAPETCSYWVKEGSGCQALCVKKFLDCQDGDGCCPSECSYKNDSDCSSNCGDGVLQTEEGEICEPGWTIDGNTPDPQIVCPVDCPDDGDPCTEEYLAGSPRNCNAVCSQTIITSFVDGDSCCPDNGNANVDSDCAPICGNGVSEADEECDGTEYCDEQCRSLIPDDQARCIKDFDIHKGVCEECTCSHCARQALTCFDSEDSNLNVLCTDVVACAHQAGCVGAACYCGTALNRLTGTCLFGRTPDGPCKEVIERAAGEANAFTVFSQGVDNDTALGRAFAFGNCYEDNCLDICR